jgi:hypothetical protein
MQCSSFSLDYRFWCSNEIPSKIFPRPLTRSCAVGLACGLGSNLWYSRIPIRSCVPRGRHIQLHIYRSEMSALFRRMRRARELSNELSHQQWWNWLRLLKICEKGRSQLRVPDHLDWWECLTTYSWVSIIHRAIVITHASQITMDNRKGM